MLTRIMVVDDDPYIRELLEVFLSKEGWEIISASDGKEALTLLDTEKVDLVILDIMMPNLDGWAVCKEIRKYYPEELPILMLTAKGETAQKVKGFELGTDDYLVKPFDPLELTARVKTLLKRYKIVASQKLQIGEVILDRKTFEVWMDNKSCTLPLKEFELLFKLASQPGKTYSRDELIEDIWGFDYEGDERTVDVHIKRLRARFWDDKHKFKISTIRGLGYRLELI